MKIQRTILFLLICMFFIFGSTDSLARTYRRSCSGYYEITPLSFRGDVFKSPEFKATEQVDYYSLVNLARSLAGEDLEVCMNKHWQYRTRDFKPIECTEYRHVYNYPYINLEKELGKEICSHYQKADEIVVTVIRKIYGNTACGGVDPYRNSSQKILATDYRINCAQYINLRMPILVQEINTDRPGSDYRNFGILDNNVNTCQKTCLEETKCKAWTFVKPGVQGKQARCWLKHSVPNKVHSPCCISGVK